MNEPATSLGRMPTYRLAPEVHPKFIVGVEFFRDCLDEMKLANADHWRDIAPGVYKGKMDPDYDRVLMLEDENLLCTVTARDRDGMLIGYIVYSINHTILQRTVVSADEFLAYVAKHQRNGRVISALLSYGEQTLRALGVQLMTMMDYSPAGKASLEPLLKRRGWRPTTQSYLKWLED